MVYKLGHAYIPWGAPGHGKFQGNWFLGLQLPYVQFSRTILLTRQFSFTSFSPFTSPLLLYINLYKSWNLLWSWGLTTAEEPKGEFQILMLKKVIALQTGYRIFFKSNGHQLLFPWKWKENQIHLLLKKALKVFLIVDHFAVNSKEWVILLK